MLLSLHVEPTPLWIEAEIVATISSRSTTMATPPGRGLRFSGPSAACGKQ